MLATRLNGLSLNRCYVAESTLVGAGSGLFASRDISRGELVTLYPGDAVRISAMRDGADDLWWSRVQGPEPGHEPEGSQHRGHDVGRAQASRNHYECKHDDIEELRERCKDYELEGEAHGAISLLGDPSRMGDPAYLGHMINDGATCSREALRSVYLAEAHDVSNVRHISPTSRSHIIRVLPPWPSSQPNSNPNPAPALIITRT